MGYLGVMAKLGPFWSRDNCSGVRGVLDRLITHLLVWSLALHVSIELEGGSLVPPLGAIVVSMLMEGVGPWVWQELLGLLVAWVEVLEKLDGTLWCPLKVHS